MEGMMEGIWVVVIFEAVIVLTFDGGRWAKLRQ
jgi:hypothetical protein